MSNKEQGKVKFFNEEKGYGFIEPSNGSSDIFVHITELERAGLGPLKQGQLVEYEVGYNKKSGKTNAIKVRLVK